MRVFLNAILAFIGSESLTDDEYETLSSLTEEEYTVETYTGLKGVLETRESVSGQLKRLKAYFISKGVAIDTPARDATSQIFLGSPL